VSFHNSEHPVEAGSKSASEAVLVAEKWGSEAVTKIKKPNIKRILGFKQV
jgi:hypothetical protein